MYSIWEKLDRKEKGYLVGIYLLSLAFVGLLGYGVGREQVEQTSVATASPQAPAPEVIPLEPNPPNLPEPMPPEASHKPLTVHVAGAVRNPGVYTLPPNARVADAIQQAGGTRADSDTDSLNLAEPLQDGQQIYVPRKHDKPANSSLVQRASASKPSPKRRPSLAFPLDINRATADELEQLPGIGPTLAQRIVEYRQQVGRFQSVDDLRNVRGIGPKRLEQIRPLIVVR
ncbi:MAG: DNA-binding protein [Armatimonadota bacterium]